MKILMVAHSFPPDAFAGVELHVYNISRLLNQRHDLWVMHRSGDPGKEEYSFSFSQYKGVNTIPLINNFKDCDPEAPDVRPGVRQAFGKILDQLKPDLVHIHHLIHLSSDLGVEAQARKIPVAASIHDYWHLCARVQLFIPYKGRCKGPYGPRCALCFGGGGKLNRFLNRVPVYRLLPRSKLPGNITHYLRRFERMRKALGQCQALIANSAHLKNRVAAFGVPKNKINVIHPGIDLSLFTRKQKPPRDRIRFGFIGSVMPHKGLNIAIAAFKGIPEADLEVWGDTDVNDEVRNYFDTLKPSKNVIFKGKFDNKEISRVLEGVDVLIIPPIWEEAYGLTLDEAKASGTPVIASRIGGLPEHLDHGKEGYLFTPNKVSDLVRIVQQFVSQPELITRLRPKIETIPSIEDTVRRIERVYATCRSQ